MCAVLHVLQFVAKRLQTSLCTKHFFGNTFFPIHIIRMFFPIALDIFSRDIFSTGLNRDIFYHIPIKLFPYNIVSTIVKQRDEQCKILVGAWSIIEEGISV
jgi:hypothetical protein